MRNLAAEQWWQQNYTSFRQLRPETEAAMLARMANVIGNPESSPGDWVNCKGRMAEVLFAALMGFPAQAGRFVARLTPEPTHNRDGIDVHVLSQDRTRMPLGFAVTSGGYTTSFRRDGSRADRAQPPVWGVQLPPTKLGVGDMLQMQQKGNFPLPEEFMYDRLQTNPGLQTMVGHMQNTAESILANPALPAGTRVFLDALAGFRMPSLAN
jgi:hypothetical protein